MSTDENQTSSDIPESPPDIRAPSPAWQPITPSGVAAFATARIGRLLFVQLIAAGLLACCVLWFVTANWFPIVREAISQLPDQGHILNQQLSTPHTSTLPLAENRFLAIVIDIDGVGTPSVATDLRVEFHRRNVAFCSVFGCLNVDYPKDFTILFNRPELQSRWGAWQPMILWLAGLGVVAWLFFSWFSLATLYFAFVRAYAFFKDRRLTLSGSWKLCAAALIPAGLLAGGTILLYGLGIVDLLRFLWLFSLHLVAAWVYLVGSPLRLPRASDAIPKVTRNPFGDEKPPGPANPFSS